MTTSIDPAATPVAGQLALIEIEEPSLDRVERASVGHHAGYAPRTSTDALAEVDGNRTRSGS